MSKPLISIITVVLNDRNNIEKTIKSVLSQTYKNFEYIIIDGGSTDGTIEIINKYLEKISKLISDQDKGLYDAMNKGTSLATGEWICYMNSGDQFNNSDILQQIFLQKEIFFSNIDVIYSDVIIDNKSKTKIRKARNLNLFWRGLPFSHQANFVKTLIAKNRPFNLDYKICADYDFFYSIFKNKSNFYYIELPIAIVDITDGISKNIKLNILYSEFLKITRKYSSPFQIVLIYLICQIEYLYAIFRRNFLI